ncbi:MAG: hypothetical protein IPJ43_03545 [Saprospiraceae bacterium]|nr:hypothetical protein [Saprospiraceae bacterium]
MPQEDIEEISSLKKAWINEKWNIHIVSFNYTRSIEKIVKTLPIVISRNSVTLLIYKEYIIFMAILTKILY